VLNEEVREEAWATAASRTLVRDDLATAKQAAKTATIPTTPVTAATLRRAVISTPP
jgi:hypothetical protein